MERIHSIFVPGPTLQGTGPTLCEAESVFYQLEWGKLSWQNYFSENGMYKLIFTGKIPDQPTGSSRKRRFFSRNTTPLIQERELRHL